MGHGFGLGLGRRTAVLVLVAVLVPLRLGSYVKIAGARVVRNMLQTTIIQCVRGKERDQNVLHVLYTFLLQISNTL